ILWCQCSQTFQPEVDVCGSGFACLQKWADEILKRSAAGSDGEVDGGRCCQRRGFKGYRHGTNAAGELFVLDGITPLADLVKLPAELVYVSNGIGAVRSGEVSRVDQFVEVPVAQGCQHSLAHR